MRRKQKRNVFSQHAVVNFISVCVLTLFSLGIFFLIFTNNSREIVQTPTSLAPSYPTRGAYLGIALYDQNYATTLAIEKDLGKRFAIVGIYQSWGEERNRFNSNWAQDISSQGSMPLITWEPWVPISGYDRSATRVDQKEYRLANIISGKFDGYIQQYAKDVKAFGRPVMIRFAHEMNGNWYPWASAFNTPSQYIAAWRHIHDLFVKVGATNVTWVWSPNQIYEEERIPYASDIKVFYPGDEYVDWVGLSAFNWAGIYKQNIWQDPADLYDQTISVLSTIQKPIMIAETASADGSTWDMKAAWIGKLAKYVKDNSQIKAVIWFNVQDNGIDWRIDGTVASKKAFQSSFDSYFLQSVK